MRARKVMPPPTPQRNAKRGELISIARAILLEANARGEALTWPQLTSHIQQQAPWSSYDKAYMTIWNAVSRNDIVARGEKPADRLLALPEYEYLLNNAEPEPATAPAVEPASDTIVAAPTPIVEPAPPTLVNTVTLAGAPALVLGNEGVMPNHVAWWSDQGDVIKIKLTILEWNEQARVVVSKTLTIKNDDLAKTRTWLRLVAGEHLQLLDQTDELERLRRENAKLAEVNAKLSADLAAAQTLAEEAEARAATAERQANDPSHALKILQLGITKLAA